MAGRPKFDFHTGSHIHGNATQAVTTTESIMIPSCVISNKACANNSSTLPTSWDSLFKTWPRGVA